jgi:hypothetical protein
LENIKKRKNLFQRGVAVRKGVLFVVGPYAGTMKNILHHEI